MVLLVTNSRDMTKPNVSEDAWLLIFRFYLAEPSAMPISLTPVCRQWYNLIHTTPSLWFRIVINVRTGKTIPLILSSMGFRDYLARTDGQDVDTPLDIEILCHAPSRQEHYSMCNTEVLSWTWCFQATCGFVEQRREQLDALFACLAGTQGTKKELKPKKYAQKKKVAPASKLRIKRWRSLVLESDGLFEMYDGSSSESWINNPVHCAPQLLYLNIRGVPAWYEPHEGFAPNLINLTLGNMPRSWKYGAITVPSLKHLSLQQSSKQILWYGMSGICPAEELSIMEGAAFSTMSIEVNFPNLKRLKIHTAITYSLLSHINEHFERFDRRLELVHLVNGDLWKLRTYFHKLPILTNAQKVIFETRSTRTPKADQSAPQRPPLLYIKKFLELSAPDTEIVAFGENSAEILAIAREEILQARERAG